MHRYLVALFVALALLLPAPAEAHRRRASAPVVEPTDERLDALARCESGGDASKNTGNGFYGAFQFHPRTWRSMPERAGWPHTHTYEEQRDSARALVLRSGWRPFPGCSRRLGFR